MNHPTDRNVALRMPNQGILHFVDEALEIGSIGERVRIQSTAVTEFRNRQCVAGAAFATSGTAKMSWLT